MYNKKVKNEQKNLKKNQIKNQIKKKIKIKKKKKKKKNPPNPSECSRAPHFKLLYFQIHTWGLLFTTLHDKRGAIWQTKQNKTQTNKQKQNKQQKTKQNKTKAKKQKQKKSFPKILLSGKNSVPISAAKFPENFCHSVK